MKKLIAVSDWAADTLAAQEYRSSVGGFLKGQDVPEISFVSVTPSSIHTSFAIFQIVETEERLGRPGGSVIFQNTDPRIESSAGSPFLIIRLTSGIILCGPHVQFNFSLIKGKVDQAFSYPVESEQNQFRSRDFYARVCAHLMENMQDEMELDEVNADSIPTLSGYYIGHIDNFGNIKTTIKHEDIKGKYEAGDSIAVEINGVKKDLRYVEYMFAGTVGELIMYPGSSGSKDNPYLEISVWSHFEQGKIETGAHEFGNPLPGVEIRIFEK